MNSAGNPIEIKVCIIGDTDVGKSTLSKRYCEGVTPENTTPTIGASFLQKRLTADGCDISLQIWDTAGQERFRSMAPMYYRHAKAAICVFDVTNEESFHRVTAWLKDLKSHADPNVVVCIAGNKCDKPAGFNLALCQQYAESVGSNFFKTSALTGEGVDACFNKLTSEVVAVCRANGQISEAKESDLVKLTSKARETEKRGGCC
jgi:small GTP-binding protein